VLSLRLSSSILPIQLMVIVAISAAPVMGSQSIEGVDDKPPLIAANTTGIVDG